MGVFGVGFGKDSCGFFTLQDMVRRPWTVPVTSMAASAASVMPLADASARSVPNLAFYEV